ncbi:MAG: hypothetical protein SGILL_009157 [Bacillariaceae sp.]
MRFCNRLHLRKLFVVGLVVGLLSNAALITGLLSDGVSAVTIPADHHGADLMYLAYYYPWYIKDDWSRHELPAGDVPQLGDYGTDSQDTANQHIEWAKDAGISSWVVSGWGEEGIPSEHFQQGMLPALDAQYDGENNTDDNQDEAMKFCLIYESMQLKRDPDMNFDNGSAQAKLVEDFQAIKKDYFDHPSYLRVGDDQRPVVVWYITRWVTNTFGTNFNRTVLDEIRQAVDEDIYFIADEPFFNAEHLTPEASFNGLLEEESGPPNDPTTVTTSVFDAYTTYNMYEAERVVPGETAAEYMLREAMPIFEAWSENPHTKFFPNVLPMYHDFRPGHGPLDGNPIDFRRQLENVVCLFDSAKNDELTVSRGDSGLRAQKLRGHHAAPKEATVTVSSDVPDMIFVTSFNEWWEGSQVEPDRDGRYGASYLEVLKYFKDYVEKYGYHWC